MSVWQFYLAIGALVALALSYRIPRAFLWVCAMALSFIASVAWQRSELPYYPAAVLAFDAMVCLLIDAFAKERWEAMLFNVYRISVGISILRLFSIIDNTTLYVVTLELCNWAALAVVIGTSLLRRGPVYGNSLWDRWNSYIRRAYTYLRAPRSADHWFKVR
ncbi:hypothetical protein [Rhizobium alvei]|uniref:Uncharacterized protein n=1 Tax=Rhizobium alvei TaxID=1132659 RepID=A0ABT8YU26_9HYPH|nr:hypothetical protein [Rhizobium alvei]MDO6967005.1 hypothetical protein [Rhizobium alvei]